MTFEFDLFLTAKIYDVIKVAWIANVKDYVRGGAEGALAPPEFEGSERSTEGETDNPLLIAPSESKF